MNMKQWMSLTALLATGLTAARGDTQLSPASTNAPVAIPVASTNAPAPKPKAPAAPKKINAATKPVTKDAPMAVKKSEAVPLLAPEPAVARQNHINIRGQASINSEVIAHLKKGDRVTAQEEITLHKPKTDEPAKWLRVSLPTNVAVWVHATFIDPATKTVVPKKLNLRAGPGENYSVLGRLEKGAAVRDLETKGDWMKIEAPTNVFGFVASHLMQRAAAAHHGDRGSETSNHGGDTDDASCANNTRRADASGRNSETSGGAALHRTDHRAEPPHRQPPGSVERQRQHPGAGLFRTPRARHRQDDQLRPRRLDQSGAKKFQGPYRHRHR